MSRAVRQACRGFTLLEVLIGLTILGMIMSVLTSSVFTLAAGARSGEERLERIDSDRQIARFLRNQVSQAYPVTKTAGGDEITNFEGRPDRLTFVGHLPSHRGGGGLNLLSLRTETVGGRRHLVLDTSNAWHDRPTASTRTGVSSRVLIEDVDDLKFGYFGSPADESRARWTDRWSDHDRLPELVRIELRVAGRTWPALVIPVRSRTAQAQSQLFVDEAPGGV